MEFHDTTSCFVEDLLDFASDIGEDDEDEDQSTFSLPEFVEEELEWISNKDAFPTVESFIGIIPSVATSHLSPVSILDNDNSNDSNLVVSSGCKPSIHGLTVTPFLRLSSAFKVPNKARSKFKRRRRNDMVGLQWHNLATKLPSLKQRSTSTTLGRKCLHCGAEKTPQWRAGPLGPKTLCNACGVRFKSGRLVPEYRPASSPTFSCDLHSNSHRKIVEMRRQKMLEEMRAKKATNTG